MTGLRVAVVFIDLDNFKTVNDRLGHNAGDDLLKGIASRMVSTVRKTDTVVRLGGDEFVLLLVGQPAERGIVSAILDKVRAAVAAPICVADQMFRVTCSMGVAIHPADGCDVDTLLINADIAMYKAKEAGRDTLRFYDPD